jgi:hypothetical protein
MATDIIDVNSTDQNPPNISGRVFLRALKAIEAKLAEIAGETNQYNPRQPREDAELRVTLVINYPTGAEYVIFSDAELAIKRQKELEAQGIDCGFI